MIGKISKSASGFLPILLVSLLFAAENHAQEAAVAPLPNSINGVLQQAGIPLPAPDEDPSSIQGADRPTSPFFYPPFLFSPHFYYRFLYEYGVQVRPGHPTTTLIDTFAPGITIGLGPHFIFDYTANWDVYSNHAFRDTLGHSVSLSGTTTLDNWNVEITQGYSYSSQPLVETAIQTTVQDYKTTLDFSRDLGRQFLTETIVNQDLRYAVLFPDSDQWSVDQWMHYRFSAQFDTALGVGAGYVHESQGSDTNYTRPQAQLNWAPTEKIDLKASGGFEHRVFLDYPRTSLNTPTYDFTIQYSPIQTTKLILNFVRQVTPSFFANESTKVSRIDLGVTQRLLKKYFLSGEVGRNDVTYISAEHAAGSVRDDGQTTYTVKLSTSFLKRGTLSLLSYRTRNSSSVAGYGFVTTQFALELGYRY
jgi:hypothetical protein